MASRDCVVDTHILVEILAQYNAATPNAKFYSNSVMSTNLVNALNKLIDDEGANGKIIASSFAFVEIVNQFEQISKNKFTKFKLYGFLQQHPEWFEIEPIDISTFKYYISVPKFTDNQERIELADAFHITAAFQRGENTKLATLDNKIQKTTFPSIVIIY